VGHDVDAPACFPAIIDRIQASLGGYRPRCAIAECDARIGYEQVDRADLLFDRFDKRRDCGLIANVDRVRKTADFISNLARSLAVQVNDDNFDVIGGKSPTKRAADAVASAGHYRNAHNLSLSV
jgi:hypothetical protein